MEEIFIWEHCGIKRLVKTEDVSFVGDIKGSFGFGFFPSAIGDVIQTEEKDKTTRNAFCLRIVVREM